MILLDTNVVSEVMRAQPADSVVAWLNGQRSEQLYVSAITLGEIAYGLRILPDGRRRSGLRERLERFIALAFDQRVLAQDEPGARIYGDGMGDRRALGATMSVPDGQIATIARRDQLAVATRNVRDFEGCGIEGIDPFEVAVR